MKKNEIEDMDEHVSPGFFLFLLLYSCQFIAGFRPGSCSKPDLLQEDVEQQKLTTYLSRSEELASLWFLTFHFYTVVLVVLSLGRQTLYCPPLVVCVALLRHISGFACSAKLRTRRARLSYKFPRRYSVEGVSKTGWTFARLTSC